MKSLETRIIEILRPRFNLLLKSGEDAQRRDEQSPLKGGVTGESTPTLGEVESSQIKVLSERSDNVEEELSGFVRQLPRINPLLYATIFSLFAAMGGFLGGYDTGIISGAMVYIKDEYKFDDIKTEVIVSGVVAGAIFGSLISGGLSDVYGRKFVSALSALTYMVGGILMSAASGFTSLFLGRLITGLAVGSGSIAPVYIGEVVPSENRGAFVNSNAFLIATGQLVSYLTAYGLSGTVRYGRATEHSQTTEPVEKGNWRLMLGLTIIPPLIQFCLLPIMPQSPRFLSSKGRTEDAAKSLLLVYPVSRDRAEIINRVKTIKTHARMSRDAKGRQLSYLHLLKTGEYRRLIMITSGLQALQQLSGINTVMYYSAFILRMAGFPSKASSILFSTLIGLSNALGSLVSMYTINRYRRRPLLLVTLVGVFVGLLNLALTFGKRDPNGEVAAPKPGQISKSSYLALSSVIIYVIFYSLGLGCVPWNIVAEIFPMEARSRGAAFAISTNWIVNFLVSITFLSLTRRISASGTFFLYALFILVGWVLIYFFVPETKGKSLEAESEDPDDPSFTMIGPH